MAQATWQDAEAYSYLRDMSASEFAWEFLRRNADYRREVAISHSKGDRAATALNAHWGLRFPDTSEPASYKRRHLLEAGRRSRCSHSGTDGLTGLDHGNDRRRPDKRQTD